MVLCFDFFFCIVGASRQQQQQRETSDGGQGGAWELQRRGGRNTGARNDVRSGFRGDGRRGTFGGGRTNGPADNTEDTRTSAWKKKQPTPQVASHAPVQSKNKFGALQMDSGDESEGSDSTDGPIETPKHTEAPTQSAPPKRVVV